MRATALLTLATLAYAGAAASQTATSEERIRALEDRLKILEERYSITVQSLHSARLEAAMESEVVRKLKIEVERQAGVMADLRKSPLVGPSTAAAGEAASTSGGIEAFEKAALARSPAGPAYRGEPRLPDFAARDREFASYRTRLRNGMGQGANFAGNLAMVEIGCGTSCRFAFAGDVRTGQVFSFPIGGEEYYNLDLRYEVGSRAVVAYWIANQRCTRGVYEWTGSAFSAGGQIDVGDADACYRRQQ